MNKNYSNVRVPCIINGIQYESYRDASRKLNLPVVKIRLRCLSRTLTYKDWNIVGQEKQLIHLHEEQEAKGQPIIADGIRYASYTEAARQLNLSTGAISNRVKSINFPRYIKDHEGGRT